MDLILFCTPVTIKCGPQILGFFGCILVPVPSLGCEGGENQALRVVHPIVTALLGCPYAVVFEFMSGKSSKQQLQLAQTCTNVDFIYGEW